MSTPLIIDEWLFHDLKGENGKRCQFETFQFIQNLVEICDKIVVLAGSNFSSKIYDLIKSSENDPVVRGMSQFFNTAIIRNSLKTYLIKPEEVKPLPSSLIKLISEDDKYLLQLHLAVKDSVIITSDTRLLEAVKNQNSIRVFLRDKFLLDYSSR